MERRCLSVSVNHVVFALAVAVIFSVSLHRQPSGGETGILWHIQDIWDNVSCVDPCLKARQLEDSLGNRPLYMDCWNTGCSTVRWPWPSSLRVYKSETPTSATLDSLTDEPDQYARVMTFSSRKTQLANAKL